MFRLIFAVVTFISIQSTWSTGVDQNFFYFHRTHHPSIVTTPDQKTTVSQLDILSPTQRLQVRAAEIHPFEVSDVPSKAVPNSSPELLPVSAPPPISSNLLPASPTTLSVPLPAPHVQLPVLPVLSQIQLPNTIQEIFHPPHQATNYFHNMFATFIHQQPSNINENVVSQQPVVSNLGSLPVVFPGIQPQLGHFIHSPLPHHHLSTISDAQGFFEVRQPAVTGYAYSIGSNDKIVATSSFTLGSSKHDPSFSRFKFLGQRPFENFGNPYSGHLFQVKAPNRENVTSIAKIITSLPAETIQEQTTTEKTTSTIQEAPLSTAEAKQDNPIIAEEKTPIIEEEKTSDVETEVEKNVEKNSSPADSETKESEPVDEKISEAEETKGSEITDEVNPLEVMKIEINLVSEGADEVVPVLSAAKKPETKKVDDIEVVPEVIEEGQVVTEAHNSDASNVDDSEVVPDIMGEVVSVVSEAENSEFPKVNNELIPEVMGDVVPVVQEIYNPEASKVDNEVVSDIMGSVVPVVDNFDPPKVDIKMVSEVMGEVAPVIPEVDKSDRPRVEEFEPPTLDESEPPKVEESEPSKLDGSDPPKVDESESPKVEESEAPKIDESDPRKVDESESPKVEESEAPKIDESDPRKVDESESPKVEESEAPKIDESDPRKVDESESPKVEESEPSKLDESGPPKVDESESPKVEQSEPSKLDESDSPKLDESDLTKVNDSESPKVDKLEPLEVEESQPLKLDESDPLKVDESESPRVEESEIPKVDTEAVPDVLSEVSELPPVDPEADEPEVPKVESEVIPEVDESNPSKVAESTVPEIPSVSNVVLGPKLVNVIEEKVAPTADGTVTEKEDTIVSPELIPSPISPNSGRITGKPVVDNSVINPIPAGNGEAVPGVIITDNLKDSTPVVGTMVSSPVETNKDKEIVLTADSSSKNESLPSTEITSSEEAIDLPSTKVEEDSNSQPIEPSLEASIETEEPIKNPSILAAELSILNQASKEGATDMGVVPTGLEDGQYKSLQSILNTVSKGSEGQEVDSQADGIDGFEVEERSYNSNSRNALKTLTYNSGKARRPLISGSSFTTSYLSTTKSPSIILKTLTTTLREKSSKAILETKVTNYTQSILENPYYRYGTVQSKLLGLPAPEISALKLLQSQRIKKLTVIRQNVDKKKQQAVRLVEMVTTTTTSTTTEAPTKRPRVRVVVKTKTRKPTTRNASTFSKLN